MGQVADQQTFNLPYVGSSPTVRTNFNMKKKERIYQYALSGKLVYKKARMYWYSYNVKYKEQQWYGAFTEKEFQQRVEKDKGTRWELYNIKQLYELPESFLAEVIEGDRNNAEWRAFLGRDDNWEYIVKDF